MKFVNVVLVSGHRDEALLVGACPFHQRVAFGHNASLFDSHFRELEASCPEARRASSLLDTDHRATHSTGPVIA
jgi:hypothetical protein